MSNLQRKLFGFKSLSRVFQYTLMAISLQLIANGFVNAQDNSPYSRFGLGDQHPSTNIFNRGMAGISAAYSDPRIDGLNDPRNGKYYPSINFSNPASYSRFYAIKEASTKKLQYGRMLLDVGINATSHALHEANNPQSFTSSNIYFSYLQLGVPIKKNWGLAFGLRPLTTIGYKIDKNERLLDPNTGSMIDSVKTQFSGEGGSFLFNTGTGVAVRNFSVGVNVGYLFGKKDYGTHRIFNNDTIDYAASNHETRTNYGGIFFNAGMQYRIDLSPDKLRYIQLGAFGNIQHKLNTHTDLIRETFIVSQSDASDLRIDSVSVQSDVKGELVYPASYGAGFIIEQLPAVNKGGWLLGVDFLSTNWDNYRFNGQPDAVKTNWQLKVGAQIRPRLKDTYKSLLAYRAGAFFGDDYIYVNNQKMPVWGITGGISLPIANLKDASRRFRTQNSVINISAEYIKRGNNDNPINEDMIRLSFGFTLSDFWFTKRKYD
ncbi:MAG TPA: hypothetical protein VNM35_04415 [Chitinophagaceae bacterium]|jgi:hypothetical protein|nr:hypothetical protein [Chitinophagaceae bacterium]